MGGDGATIERVRVLTLPLKRYSALSIGWALAPLAFAGVACAVPWLLVRFSPLALALQYGFSLVCHQRPDRSFFLFAGTVAVCTRCLGIYLGAAIGLVFRVPRQVAWRLLLATTATSAIDFLAELSGLHRNWMFARFALGLALGTAAAMLVTSSTDEVNIPTQAEAA